MSVDAALVARMARALSSAEAHEEEADKAFGLGRMAGLQEARDILADSLAAWAEAEAALAAALRTRVLDLLDTANDHMAGRKTDERWLIDAAAILAAIPGWTLVSDLERAAGETAQARERECEAEIARLLAALERIADDPDGRPWTIADARAALAGGHDGA